MLERKAYVKNYLMFNSTNMFKTIQVLLDFLYLSLKMRILCHAVDVNCEHLVRVQNYYVNMPVRVPEINMKNVHFRTETNEPSLP